MVFTLKLGIYLIPDGYLPGIYWVFTLTRYLPDVFTRYLHPGFYFFPK